MVDMDNIIKEMEKYAEENNVPIMTKDGIEFFLKYIKENNIVRILEVGTAIGYSAIRMCTVRDDIVVTTIERDEVRYNEAVKNVSKAGFEKRINLIFGDALEVELDGEFDLIFIDAAKAQNQKFFEMFKRNLKSTGTIITDNMKFHGLVDTPIEQIESRNLRQLVRKVRRYTDFLKENTEFNTEFLELGDGIAISKYNTKE